MAKNEYEVYSSRKEAWKKRVSDVILLLDDFLERRADETKSIGH